jgi:hypothetical protein
VSNRGVRVRGFSRGFSRFVLESFRVLDVADYWYELQRYTFVSSNIESCVVIHST